MELSGGYENATGIREDTLIPDASTWNIDDFFSSEALQFSGTPDGFQNATVSYGDMLNPYDASPWITDEVLSPEALQPLEYSDGFGKAIENLQHTQAQPDTLTWETDGSFSPETLQLSGVTDHLEGAPESRQAPSSDYLIPTGSNAIHRPSKKRHAPDPVQDAREHVIVNVSDEPQHKRTRNRYGSVRRQEVATVRNKGACFPCRIRKVAVSRSEYV